MFEIKKKIKKGIYDSVLTADTGRIKDPDVKYHGAR